LTAEPSITDASKANRALFTATFYPFFIAVWRAKEAESRA